MPFRKYNPLVKFRTGNNNPDQNVYQVETDIGETQCKQAAWLSAPPPFWLVRPRLWHRIAHRCYRLKRCSLLPKSLCHPPRQQSPTARRPELATLRELSSRRRRSRGEESTRMKIRRRRR